MVDMRAVMAGPYSYLPFGLSAGLCFVLTDSTVQHIIKLGTSVAQLTLFRLESPFHTTLLDQ